MSLEIKLPEMGENIESVEISGILVTVGETIAMDQPIVEVETEKASAEVPSDQAGVVSRILVKIGDTVQIGQPLMVLDGEPAGATKADPPKADPAPEPAVPEPEPAPFSAQVVQAVPFSPEPVRPIGDPAPAAPSVRRLSRQLGVDINTVKGSGHRGRISIDDVKAHTKAMIQAGAGATAAMPGSPPLPDFTRFGEVRKERMSKIRHTTAVNMARAWTTIPHVTQHDRADVTDIERVRKRYELTVTAIITKVVATALKKFPDFNASIDVAGREIIYKENVHIGVAVDTDRGLLVPVVRDADRKSMADIAVEIGELAARARDRKITTDDLEGGTFTISNLGGLGTTYFSPIVNWPEVAILGVGRSEVQPRYVNDSFVPRKILPLSLSYDHRQIDGANAARFLRFIAESLEQPLLLALGR
ncbi:MAG: 2-oxo acid dehydrogenase subunit E2 [Acidobacteria bacterium]|uniref:Dihydrolipoamide acetyltransferase component of pyruvate dehydrogenase complex n=1 Tax=Candidatus Polarisedimenticola svalbardensis TaxID=2886004 RepID=A0A8J7C3Q6_9BACT|nr:2-oxo acid dehydrogenase subunit E2 [Candidatus Polarisedimenticola svalbardensis]